MTNGEALKACLGYPVDDKAIELICIKRGLDMSATLNAEDRRYRLCEADVRMYVVNYPSSVSEGGISISKGEIDNLRYEANAIYSDCGEEEKNVQPKVKWYQC